MFRGNQLCSYSQWDDKDREGALFLELARRQVVTGSRNFPNTGHQSHEPGEAFIMHDNPIHTFFQVLGNNIPGQLSPGGFRWFEVVLYWVLLIGSLAIAHTNWRLDSTQRTGTHLSIYAMRLVICAHGMFAVVQAGRSLGIDTLLAKRVIPGLPYDGTVARAISYAL
jgi:hypothetical protein